MSAAAVGPVQGGVARAAPGLAHAARPLLRRRAAKDVTDLLDLARASANGSHCMSSRPKCSH